MNVAFDTWALGRQRRNSGIFNYSLSLLNEFRKLAGQEQGMRMHVFTSVGNDAASVQPGVGFHHAPASALEHSRRWRVWGMTTAARRVEADVVFSPTAQALPLSSIPLVTTVHDAIPVLFGGEASGQVRAMLRGYLWVAAKFSRHVIAVSARTKCDLVDVYGIAPEKVSIVYNGYDRNTFNCNAPDRSERQKLNSIHGIDRPYLFHHGTLQPRKNLERLVRAHRLLLDRNPSLELDLILVGAPGWRYEDLLTAAEKASCTRGKVVLTGPLPDRDLVLLLKGAEMCVIPSLYEGFCIPMVEAMACGVPTITSNSSCFPEVSGGVLKYFDPVSVEDIAGTIQEVLDDRSERTRLIQSGILRASTFSWRRAAQETMQVLATVAACRK